MPIQIVDNFDLSSAKPIDNRLVVGPGLFYPNRAAITNLYPGLRVWDFDNATTTGLGYVWTGTAWVSENTTSITGGGSVGRIPYWNTTTSIIDSDIRYDATGQNVGIAIAAETGGSAARLVVSGNIKSSGGVFVGSAWNGTTGITNIHATNISTGTMDITRLQGSTNVGWILTSDNVNATSYKNPSTINVGSATQLQTSRAIFGQNFNGTQNVSGDMIINGQVGRAANLGLLSGGVNSSGTKIATISFQSAASVNKTLSIPNTVANTDTFAFLGSAQTFAASQTFAAPTTMTTGSITTLNFPSGSNSGLQLSKIGSHYLRVNSNSGLSGIWFSNLTQDRSLYLDNNGDLITGGSSGQRFNNFQLWNDGGTMRAYFRDQITAMSGIKVNYTSSQTRNSANANTAQSMVFTHNLGYIPIVNWTINAGNVATTGSAPYGVTITSITTTTVTIYVGTNNGGNATTVTVYCY